MLFSCSSGATVRYLEDIFRAISMPDGMQIQFRYATKYIHPGILERLKANRHALDGQKIVLTYLNQSDEQHLSGNPPRVVPCRQATIKGVEWFGTSITLTYELGEFVFPKTTRIKEPTREEVISYDDYQGYVLQQNKSSESSCPLPLGWKEEIVAQRAKGFWLCDVEQPNLDTVSSSDEKVWLKWQQLTDELGSSSDFKRNGIAVFYHLLYIREVQSKRHCQIKDNVCRISSTGEHEIGVYVYATKEEVHGTTWIWFSSLMQKANFQSSPILSIDSGYDRKNVRIYVPPSPKVETEILTIDFREQYDQKYGKLQYDLMLRISPHYSSLFWSSLSLGLAGSISGLVALWKATPTGFPYILAVVVVAAACGLSFVGGYFQTARK